MEQYGTVKVEMQASVNLESKDVYNNIQKYQTHARKLQVVYILAKEMLRVLSALAIPTHWDQHLMNLL